MTSSKTKVKRVRPLLGTYVGIELAAQASERALNVWINAGFDAVSHVDRLMSFYRADSDLGRLNAAKPGEWLKIHRLTRRLLSAAQQLFVDTGGAFDVRCGNVSADGRPPFQIAGNCARKTGPWTLDLGGIAKGFAVDYAVERIQSAAGCVELSGMMNAGGDLRVWGKDSETLHIEIPGEELPMIKTFEIGSAAVATSSLRKNSEDRSARLTRARHRRMPSGKILRGRRTAVVIADECLYADALTKIILAAPPSVADRCLSSRGARGFLFGAGGKFLDARG